MQKKQSGAEPDFPPKQEKQPQMTQLSVNTERANASDKSAADLRRSRSRSGPFTWRVGERDR